VVSGRQSIVDENSERDHAGDSFSVLTEWWELNVATKTCSLERGFCTVEPDIVFCRPVLDMLQFTLTRISIAGWHDYVCVVGKLNNSVSAMKLCFRHEVVIGQLRLPRTKLDLSLSLL